MSNISESPCDITHIGCQWECTGELADDGEENYWDYVCLDCGRERDWSKYEFQNIFHSTNRILFNNYTGTSAQYNVAYIGSNYIKVI